MLISSNCHFVCQQCPHLKFNHTSARAPSRSQITRSFTPPPPISMASTIKYRQYTYTCTQFINFICICWMQPIHWHFIHIQNPTKIFPQALQYIYIDTYVIRTRMYIHTKIQSTQCIPCWHTKAAYSTSNFCGYIGVKLRSVKKTVHTRITIFLHTTYSMLNFATALLSHSFTTYSEKKKNVNQHAQ